MHYLKFHLNPKSIRAFRPIRITLVTAPTYKIGLTIPLKQKKQSVLQTVIFQSGYHNTTYSLFLLKLDLITPQKKQTISHKSRVTWIA